MQLPAKSNCNVANFWRSWRELPQLHPLETACRAGPKGSGILAVATLPKTG